MDIVKIQRHILGTEIFPSPWHLLAADVNGDHRVTAADIAAVRKLILGVDGKYKSNLSWMFLDANYQFPDPNDPWIENLPAEYNIISLAGPMMYADFRGIKVGDVSQTTWNGLHHAETRSLKNMELELGEPVNKHLVPIFAKEAMRLSGMQFTLKFNSSQLNITGIKPGKIAIMDPNIGWAYIDKSYILVSWNADQDVDISKGDLLFL